MRDGEVELKAAAADPLAADVLRVSALPSAHRILEVVCRTTGMGFAAVARVTDERWVACAVRDEIAFGMVPGGELQLETTLCNEIRQRGELVVIDHVADHPDFCGHHTPARYGFQSYISVPIRLADGTFWGTLCAIDPNPAKLDRPEVRGMFTLSADLLGFHLDAAERLEASEAALGVSEAALTDARAVAELRDQFVAVLGHDLRNPIASVEAGAVMLQKEPLSPRATEVVQLIRGSTARMKALVDNVLDFARARLGGGFALDLSEAPLRPALEQVISELRAAWPYREITADLRLDAPVRADAERIGQLLSNLLANALQHGDPRAPVRVEGESGPDGLTLSVANAGRPIPPEKQARLFQPFARGGGVDSGEGLGLGLYIACEIARAHGGTLAVTSDAAETRFTLRVRG